MQWTIASDELAHSGKKGMRWYHRLYQNKDGTWTALGKKRRREMSDGAKKRADRKEEGKNLKSKGELDTERANYKITKLKNKAAVQEARSGVQTVGDKLAGKLKTGASAASKMVKQKVEEKKKHDQEVSAEEIIRSGDMNKIIKNKDKLTNAQFKEAVDRMDLERRLQGVSNAQKQDALDTYRRFAGFVNTTANLAKDGISAYNSAASVMNTFMGKDWKIVNVKGNKNSNSNRSNDDDDDDDGGSSGSSHQSHGNQNSSNQHNSQHASNSSNQESNSSSNSNSHGNSSNSSSSNNRDNSSNSSSSRNSHWSPEREAESQERVNRAMNDISHANALWSAAKNRYGADSSQARQMEQLYHATNTIATAARASHDAVHNSNPAVQQANRREAIRNIANMPVTDAVQAVRRRASSLTLSRAAREANRQQAEYDARQAAQRLDEANTLVGSVNMENWRRSLGLDDTWH